MKTTKIIAILFFTVLGLADLQAQSHDRFSIGPRGGVNFSNVSNVDESQNITGVVVGVTSTYSLAEHTGLTVDALYSVEGYKAPFENYHLRYLQFPVYFDYFFGQLGERFRPKLYAGVAPSFFLSGTLNDLEVNEPYYNQFLVSLSAGTGFNWRVGNRIWLNTDLRYFHGLSDIRNEDVATGDAVQPRNIQLSFGLAYGLAKL